MYDHFPCTACVFTSFNPAVSLIFLKFFYLYQTDNIVCLQNCFDAVAGVYLAESLNSILGENWKSFASQNYFNPSGVFMSVLWSGPLLAFAMIILVSIFPYDATIMPTVIFSYSILTISILSLSADQYTLFLMLLDCEVEKS